MSFKRAARLCSWGWVIGLSLASISPALSFFRPLPIHATSSSPGTTEQKNKDSPSREQEWIVIVDKLANILFDHEQWHEITLSTTTKMPVQLHFFGISSVGIGNETVKTAASCLHRKKDQRRVLVETVRPTPLGKSKNINRSHRLRCRMHFLFSGPASSRVVLFQEYTLYAVAVFLKGVKIYGK